jgi:ribonuclease BN (tRNA processing enzyme)
MRQQRLNLTVLGSGTGVPSLERSSPAYLLRANGGEILIDCGSGTLRQLLRTGTSHRSIDAVFITHTHPDHIGDLIPLIHALKCTPGFKRERPLRLFGPPGFEAYFEHRVATVAIRPKHFAIEVVEVVSELTYADFRILTTPVSHSEQVASVAYRFDANGHSIVFSGDCDIDARLVRLAQQADVLIIDASFPDTLKVPGHLSASECGRIAAEANVKQMILSHLYPVEISRDTRLEEARAQCSKTDVCLAEDLMTVDF